MQEEKDLAKSAVIPRGDMGMGQVTCLYILVHAHSIPFLQVGYLVLKASKPVIC